MAIVSPQFSFLCVLVSVHNFYGRVVEPLRSHVQMQNNPGESSRTQLKGTPQPSQHIKWLRSTCFACLCAVHAPLPLSVWNWNHCMIRNSFVVLVAILQFASDQCFYYFSFVICYVVRLLRALHSFVVLHHKCV
jgi:hypothetical protein